MKKHESLHLDFVVDRLTNSIQNTISGDSFITEVLRFTKSDLKQVIKKNGWNFNWKGELADNKKEVFKLTIINNSDIVQGLPPIALVCNEGERNLRLQRIIKMSARLAFVSQSMR